MKKNLHTFPIGALTTLMFFVVGFSGHWQYAWVVFLASPILYWFINALKSEEKDQTKAKELEEEEDDELDF